MRTRSRLTRWFGGVEAEGVADGDDGVADLELGDVEQSDERLILGFRVGVGGGLVGGLAGIGRITCDRCGRSGTQVVERGGFAMRQTCARCGGVGEVVERPCAPCGGSGRVRRPRNVKVRIPAGVDDGQTIRLPGRGEPGHDGGPPGDLYVTVGVDPHPTFGRVGNHLTLTVPVTYPEAVLGAAVTVPTLDGDTITVRVSPGTPPGRVLRVSGRGVPKPDEQGDLLLTIDLDVPTDPSPLERDLIEQLAAAATSRPGARWAGSP